MRCPYCNHESIAGAERCESCGRSLVVAAAPTVHGGMQERILTEPLTNLTLDKPIRVSLRSTVSDAIEVMKRHHHGSVLVMDGSTLSGIFTERDVLTRVVGAGVDPKKTELESVMTPDPTTLCEDDPLAFAIHLMAARDLRHVVVMRDDTPVGIASIRGVLSYVTKQAL